MEGGVEQDKIVYKDLSYRIIGIMFDVYNNLGSGYQEKYYQRAIELALLKENIRFRPQCPYRIIYKEKIIGRYFMDFIIDDRMVLEIKRGDYFSRKNIGQVIGYLKATKLKLGIIVNFTSDGVKYKRILNIK